MSQTLDWKFVMWTGGWRKFRYQHGRRGEDWVHADFLFHKTFRFRLYFIRYVGFSTLKGTILLWPSLNKAFESSLLVIIPSWTAECRESMSKSLVISLIVWLYFIFVHRSMQNCDTSAFSLHASNTVYLSKHILAGNCCNL